MVSHATCLSHRRFVLSLPCFSRHVLFVSSCYPVCLVHTLWIKLDRVCVLLSLCHRFQPSFLQVFSTLVGMGSTTLATRTMWSAAAFLKHVSVEIRSSRSHFRPLFGWTYITDFFTSTERDRLIGIPRIPKADYQELFVPEIAARKSSRRSSHQCSARCRQSMFSHSCQQTLLCSIANPAQSPPYSTFHLTARAPSRNSCHAHFCTLFVVSGSNVKSSTFCCPCTVTCARWQRPKLHFEILSTAYSVSTVALHQLARCRAISIVDGSWSHFISALTSPSLSTLFSIP